MSAGLTAVLSDGRGCSYFIRSSLETYIRPKKLVKLLSELNSDYQNTQLTAGKTCGVQRCDCSWANLQQCKIPSLDDGSPCWRKCCCLLSRQNIPGGYARRFRHDFLSKDPPKTVRGSFACRREFFIGVMAEKQKPDTNPVSKWYVSLNRRELNGPFLPPLKKRVMEIIGRCLALPQKL